jgi:Short C-terminal domain
MPHLTPEGERLVADAAKRHGVSAAAATLLLDALVQGNGRQAQFDHPDLGGMGQWSKGGMIMIGDMFNSGLKARVDALCNELSGFVQREPGAWIAGQSQGADVSLFVAASGSAGAWWPADFGSPSSTGAQNDLAYAFFPAARRLAIRERGEIRVYDTGEHGFSGFSQAQSGAQSLTFTSASGVVRLANLQLIDPQGRESKDWSAQTAPRSPPAARASAPGDDVLKTIERLAELRAKGVLTEEEFASKKAELLSRL